ncbi:MAG: alpha/beta fold hydrolase [Acetobacter sp.]|uniref:alpha/beta fold hydrolase n=1 Tax=Acetobacter sp. TaxID=440 RepID=UPI003D033D0C
MADPRVLLVHGWGFGPAFWAPMRERLGWADVSVADLGFFGGGQGVAPAALAAFCQEDRPVLAVGHSLGFLWLASQVALPAGSFLAGINAFGCFAARPDFSAGVTPRVLGRMAQGLDKAPLTVVNDFRARCGAAALPDGATLDVPALKNGLALLREGDARASLARMGARVAVLASEDDPIVPQAMSLASLPASLSPVWATGGHLLPQTATDACAAFVSQCRQTMRETRP